MSTPWTKLIKQLQELQNEFIHAVTSLDPSEREKSGVCGVWSPKQVVAHMTGWEIETILQFQRVRDSNEAIEHDIDAFNEKSVQQRKHLSWKETIEELTTIQNRFNETLRSISPDDESINKQYLELMDVQIEHYMHHTGQLEEWLKDYL